MLVCEVMLERLLTALALEQQAISEQNPATVLLGFAYAQQEQTETAKRMCFKAAEMN